MAWFAETLWCDGCGVEIRWKPKEKSQLYYCCNRCLLGEKCDCEDQPDEYPSIQNNQQYNITLTSE